MHPAFQNALWSLPHGSTEHIPGKLSICMGMPVMLRNNDATECCMTKGAEGTVAGWQASIGKQGKPMLDTLFVKLSNPPKLVQIEGLPLNVVPITRRSTKTVCKLWNDDVITISRNQVLVLPNFAMTDYSAQGHTRPDNVVELNNCKTHQSYYTCLSRSATADGTIILQGFDSSKITGGAPGYLRQEFWELEILDYISKMRYLGTLLINIDGHRRNTLILQFQSWKGANYVPEEVHPSIQWSAAHPFIMQERNDVSWHIPKNVKVDKVGTEKVNHFNTSITAKGSIPIYQIQEESNVGKKRKLEELPGVASKKQKQSNEDIVYSTPRGLIWDGVDYSCAYDALFSILHNIWLSDPITWSETFSNTSQILEYLTDGFQDMELENITFEQLRNNVRRLLHHEFENMFPYGHRGTSVVELATKVFSNIAINSFTQLECVNCQFSGEREPDSLACIIFGYSCEITSVREQLKKAFVHHTRMSCPECLTPLQRLTYYQQTPRILLLSAGGPSISVNKSIKIRTSNQSRIFKLKGIVYHGGFHFTSRIIIDNNAVWYHDGQLGPNCRFESELSDFSETDLNSCGGRQISLIIYTQD